MDKRLGRPRTLEVAGERFGFLTVLRRSGEYRKNRKWLCMCDCGKHCNVTLQHLRNGGTRSCGCKRRELQTEKTRTHGAASNGVLGREYQSYVAMMHRCFNPKRASWKRYGGRGITVSEETWLLPSPQGYLNFVKDMGSRPEDTTLDRIDSEGNYCKENCRWADLSTQAHNRHVDTTRTSSKYRGVSISNLKSKCWVARIGDTKGGCLWLGSFCTEVEAAEAYNKKAVELHGEEAKLNEIPE